MLKALFTCKDPLKRVILAAVLILHVVFIAVVILSSHFSSKKPSKKLVVKTIVPSSSLPTMTENSSALKKSPSLPKPIDKKQTVDHQGKVEKKTTPKKQTSPPATQNKKPLSPKPKEVKKEAKPVPIKPPPKQSVSSPKSQPVRSPKSSIPDALLKDLEESIAKIEGKEDKVRSTKPKSAVSMPLPSLSIDSKKEEMQKDSYSEILIAYLHEHLSLPDYGEVKIQLHLRQDGTVITIKILNTQSERNKKYLQEQLKTLKFPCFEETFADHKEATFILTFCNES